MPPPCRRSIFFLLEERLPAWRSMELFGPPGSGKSTLCINLADNEYILDALRLSNDAILSRLMNKAPAKLPLPLPRRLRRLWYKHFLKSIINEIVSSSRIPPPTLLYTFLERQSLLLENSTSRDRTLAIFRAMALSKITFESPSERRVLFDEGMLKNIIGVVARSHSILQRRMMLDYFQPFLSEYPGQKNALLVDASPESCLNHQRQRGLVIPRGNLIQTQFHRVCYDLADVLQKEGWQVGTLEASCLTDGRMP